MERFWIIAGGCAWLVVAIAIFRKALPHAGSPALNRLAGARCLLGTLLGVATLALVLWSISDLAPVPRTVVSLLAHLAFAIFLVGFAMHVEPGRDVLGLQTGTALTDLVRGAATYAAFIPVVIAAHVLNGWIVGNDVEAAQKPVHEILGDEGPGRLAMIANLVIAVPFFEETLFRGLLQQGVRAQLAFAAPALHANALSVVIASIGFTLLHPPATYVPVLVLSLILGSAFARAGRLLVPISLHAMHNLAVVLFELGPRQWAGTP